MKNYSIIEDLTFDHQNIFNQKNYPEKLYQCFIRNYYLIKKYGICSDQLILTKFKKSIISKYIQELYLYSHETLQKKKKFFYQNYTLNKKNKNFSEELISKNSSNKNMKIQQQNKAIRIACQKNKNKITKNYSQPITDQTINSFKNTSQREVFSVKKGLLNIKPAFKFKIQTQLQPIQTYSFKVSNIKSDNNLKPSIYNDSINFNKKYIFQSTLNKISRTRQQRQKSQQKQNEKNFSLIRNSYTDQKSLQSKMINILKQRKSHKNLKAKFSLDDLFSRNIQKELKVSNYIKEQMIFRQNSKILIERSNLITKIQTNNERESIKQAKEKIQTIFLGLKGKVCFPFKHQFSNSWNIESNNSDKINNVVTIMAKNKQQKSALKQLSLMQIGNLSQLNLKQNICQITGNKILKNCLGMISPRPILINEQLK